MRLLIVGAAALILFTAGCHHDATEQASVAGAPPQQTATHPATAQTSAPSNPLIGTWISRSSESTMQQTFLPDGTQTMSITYGPHANASYSAETTSGTYAVAGSNVTMTMTQGSVTDLGGQTTPLPDLVVVQTKPVQCSFQISGSNLEMLMPDGTRRVFTRQ